MLEHLVQYLRSNSVPFRLFSHPSAEPLPSAAQPLAAGAQLVRAQVIVVDGRPAIACVADGRAVNLAALAAELDTTATEGSARDLPTAWAGAGEFLPPLGGFYGVPLFVDASLAKSSTLVFRAFSSSDYVEVPFAEFSLLEQPRLSALAVDGLLPASQPPQPVTLSDEEVAAVCRALDNYLPELTYEVTRVERSRGRHELAELERILTSVRQRLAAQLAAHAVQVS
jgi:Ala-tRNA(Pro) deacylase